MTQQKPPDWLAELQARFGSVIRTPLDTSTGTLRATPSAYDPEVGALPGPSATAAERLAVYNRQYWFRLFDVFHTAFPLATRLVGHWRFNQLSTAFLLEQPPRGWDIDHVPDGFERWLEGALPEPGLHVDALGCVVPREALLEAARIDAARRRVFRAPEVSAYRPTAADGTRLLASRLDPSPAVARVTEHWPLLELARALAADEGEAPVPLPARLERPRCWALARRPEGIVELALDPREAELFELLEQHAVADALARLELACTDAEREALPERARRWLARSVELDFWIGLAAPAALSTTRS